MSSRYSLQTGECINLIAGHFSVPADKLASLNSSQINNLSLVFDNGAVTLDLSEPIETDGTRIPFVSAPTEINGGNDTCSDKTREWADILYVPAHPTTGQAMWYAISEFTKGKLLEEKAILDNGITSGDTKSILQHLNRLGVLSKFSAKVHEHFMSEQDAQTYRTLVWTKQVITLSAYGDWNPNDFLISASKLVNIDLETSRAEIAEDEAAKNRAISYYNAFPGTYYTELDNDTQEVKARLKKTVDHRLKTLILTALDERIEEMNQSAEQQANAQVSEDGSKFVYDKKLKYFTTQEEETLSSLIKTCHESREMSDETLALSSHDTVRAYIETWDATLQSELDKIDTLSPTASPDDNLDLRCALSLRAMNYHGMVIKEQCLTLNQLEGPSARNQGPRAFEFLSWREAQDGNAKPLDITQEKVVEAIKALYRETHGEQYDNPTAEFNMTAMLTHTNYDWSYYPTKALILVIDATIKTHQAALTQLFGGSTPFDAIFKMLLWAKKVALARLAFLKGIAQEKTLQGLSSLRFVFGDKVTLPATPTLIWDETSFTPKQATLSGFINKAEFNDIQVVECSLLSDGQVFYVRGPQWYMPASGEATDRLYAKAMFHVQVLANDITFTQSATASNNIIDATTLEDALKAISKRKSTASLIPLVESLQTQSVFWQDRYHFPDNPELSKNASETSVYSVEAGAQLLRFVTEAKTQLNQPLSSYNALLETPLKFGASGTESATLTALQGQLAFTFWLPWVAKNHGLKSHHVDKVTPCTMTWMYQDKEQTVQQYQLGGISACLSGAVYGLAAASCQLSSQIEIGPTHVDEGFGIRGNTVGLFDANIRNVNNLTPDSLRAAEQAKLASQASLTVNAFAGVEVGGKLDAEVYWHASDKATPLKLGSINGQLSAAYGAGYSADYALILQNGVLVFIAKASLVVGPGCAGKVAITLDAEATDAFLHRLLGVFKQENFSRLSLFGEVDEHGKNESFELLNDVLTIAFATGLTVASVLLIPTHFWSLFKQQALSQQYAPMVADNVLVDRPAEQAVVKTWVEKLPPETLCNVLNCLAQHQTSSSVNHKQAQAIVQIMAWLSDDKKASRIAKQRQWKETLIAMGHLSVDEKKDKALQWQAYKEQWFKLACFVEAYGGRRFMELFSEYSQQLCGNMVLTRSNERRGKPNGIVLEGHEYAAYSYSAYPVSVVSNATAVGHQAITKTEAAQSRTGWTVTLTDEIITPWSIRHAIK